MNIDERLDRLVERHEALTQSGELLTHMHRETEKAHAKNEVLMAQVLESIDSLARIAHAREQRISGLEGGLPQ